MNRKIIKLLALAMLAVFFLPYIAILKQWDLIILLLGGLALPTYDFLTSSQEQNPD